jgi:hypothetical protein
VGSFEPQVYGGQKTLTDRVGQRLLGHSDYTPNLSFRLLRARYGLLDLVRGLVIFDLKPQRIMDRIQIIMIRCLDRPRRFLGTPSVSPGPALVTNLLCPWQAKRTMCV